ncbi:hypothetical protein [Pseudoroseicyclus aestuarii]|uniref:Uncharacterized protein n=1 Tax=Pseudoroseicyclus aestuarii TaxID=1795041 RepID=A0A318SSH0_9RHOB|nr:hypothetical protein [Pseudoroseicyclus aestuarii]PYE80830.1 hypothetical protein DFP88_11140 [Pseudoroseicyclus aestuarii]
MSNARLSDMKPRAPRASLTLQRGRLTIVLRDGLWGSRFSAEQLPQRLAHYRGLAEVNPAGSAACNVAALEEVEAQLCDLRARLHHHSEILPACHASGPERATRAKTPAPATEHERGTP